MNFESGRKPAIDKNVEARESMPLTPFAAVVLASLGTAALADTAVAAEKHPSPDSKIGVHEIQKNKVNDVFARLAARTIGELRKRGTDEKLDVSVRVGIDQIMKGIAGENTDPESIADLKEAGKDMANDVLLGLVKAVQPELAKLQQGLENRARE